MKGKTQISASMCRELNKKGKRMAVGMMIFGIVGVVVWGVVTFLLEGGVEPIGAVSIVSLLCGIVFLRIYGKHEKTSACDGRWCEYALDEDHFTVYTSKEEENIGQAKVYYKDVRKIEETENYLFLYVVINHVYPILKSTFEEGEKAFLLQRIEQTRQVKKK